MPIVVVNIVVWWSLSRCGRCHHGCCRHIFVIGLSWPPWSWSTHCCCCWWVVVVVIVWRVASVVVNVFSLMRDRVVVVDTLLLLLVGGGGGYCLTHGIWEVVVVWLSWSRWLSFDMWGGWRSRGGRSTVRTNLVTDPSPTKMGTGMLRCRALVCFVKKLESSPLLRRQGNII